jgi:hypothetical protein
MQTKDHLALGHYLLNKTHDAGLHRHARAFLLGCVEPDYNQLSYLRGFKGHRKFRGHNAENSFAHVSKCMGEFQRDGLRAAWDYFTLGTMLHYAADAFTAPHNAFWSAGLIAHAAYEGKLHGVFADELKRRYAASYAAASASPLELFKNTHQQYIASSKNMKTDCRFIIETCEAMLLGSLQWATPVIEEDNEIEGEIIYEGAYHHGLVQAGH